MSILDQLPADGFFWRASTPDLRVRGRLHVPEAQRPVLDLVSWFDQDEEDEDGSLGEDVRVPSPMTIHGLLDSDTSGGAGMEVSLIEAQETGWVGTPERVRMTAVVAICGALLDGADAGFTATRMQPQAIELFLVAV